MHSFTLPLATTPLQLSELYPTRKEKTTQLPLADASGGLTRACCAVRRRLCPSDAALASGPFVALFNLALWMPFLLVSHDVVCGAPNPQAVALSG